MNFIIQTKNLTKTFTAIDNINLTVQTGEIFGFLGPNGAGKTTTMRMLTTLLKPTSGTAYVAGYDLATEPELVRMNIGYVSQSGGLEASATARENLVLQAKIYGFDNQKACARADELIKAFSLGECADRYVETYSGGQRRRVDIVLGLVHKPKLLFLDEPTVGLDPTSRAQVWEQIRNLRAQGTTIFLTTHYLDEADILCDRVAIVDHGTLVALDAPQTLKNLVANDSIILEVAQDVLDTLDIQTVFSQCADARNITRVNKEAASIRLLVKDGKRMLPVILRYCDTIGLAPSSIMLHGPSLDDVFLQKTGHVFEEINK